MTTCLVITGAGGELGRSVLATARQFIGLDQIVATSRMSPIKVQADRIIGLTGIDLATDEGSRELGAVVSALSCDTIGLIHCAGAFPSALALHRMPISGVEAAFKANVSTFIGAVTAVLPKMRANKNGRIVGFTSHTQSSAYPYLGAFNLSKVALLSAVQTFANENARHSIAVNALSVATLQTATERQIKPSGHFDDWISLERISKFSIKIATTEDLYVSGSEIQYWRYSDSFFGKSVLERNNLDAAISDPIDE